MYVVVPAKTRLVPHSCLCVCMFVSIIYQQPTAVFNYSSLLCKGATQCTFISFVFTVSHYTLPILLISLLRAIFFSCGVLGCGHQSEGCQQMPKGTAQETFLPGRLNNAPSKTHTSFCFKLLSLQKKSLPYSLAPYAPLTFTPQSQYLSILCYLP